jgi:hypothetical protein
VAAWEKANDIRDGLVQTISEMTATTPEGWRALAEAADNAAAHDGPFGEHAAAMIFVMQCSLLGKRKRIRDQALRMAEPAARDLRMPAAPATPPVRATNVEIVSPKADAAITPPSPPPVRKPCKSSASKKIVDEFRFACERAFAPDAPLPTTIPIKIREHEAMAAANDGTWESLAAWLHIIETSALAGLGRLHATA